MKKILLIMLITFTTMTNAGEGKYSMMSATEEDAVWVLNTENGDIKQCFWNTALGVICSEWRKNDKEYYKDED